jgi:broad specificity phosphatase PhoE
MEILRSGLDLRRDGYAIEPRLAELLFGRWEGLTDAEVRALDGAALAVRERDKWNFTTLDGESYAGLLARVRAWHAGVKGDIIVAAHGGVARDMAGSPWLARGMAELAVAMDAPPAAASVAAPLVMAAFGVGGTEPCVPAAVAPCAPVTGIPAFWAAPCCAPAA